MICDNCNRELTEGSRFCNFCGTEKLQKSKTKSKSKTLSLKKLNKKIWYRLIKVLYLLAHVWFILYVINESSEDIYTVLIGLIIFIPAFFLMMEIIKRIFYYIVLGTIRPKKTEK